MKSAAPFTSLILICCFSLNSQQTQAQVSEPVSQFSIWGGYSFNSVPFLGKTQNSQSKIIVLGYQQEIWKHSSDKAIWYTAAVIPYIHYNYPKRDEGNRMVSRSGFGLSPIGFGLSDSTPKRLSPFLQTSGGFILMESNFPTDRSRRLNFTFDISIGGNFRINQVAMLSFGYKFHHISNAETGSENPGLDSNFIFLKFSIQ